MPAWATASWPPSSQRWKGRPSRKFFTRSRNAALSLVHLCNGLVEAVTDFYLLAVEPAQELHVVISRNAECVPGFGHRHDDAQHIRRARAAVDEIADENRAAAAGRVGDCLPLAVAGFKSHAVAQLAKQLFELTRAAVHVADNVERAASSGVCPGWRGKSLACAPLTPR